jgi:hypothetical protein
MNEVIISSAIDAGINDYLEYRFQPEGSDFNSFNVIVIRLLCLIYQEDFIVNPYLQKQGSDFDINLTKYGFELDRVIDFKEQVQKAYDLSQNQKINPYFLTIQKILIDMLMYRKDNGTLTDIELNDFYDLLYTPLSKNPLQLSYNFLNTTNPWEIDDYFKQEMVKHQKVDVNKQKVILNPDVYPMFGISMEQVNDMTADYLDFINHQIYLHFGIKDNMINKEYLLEEAIAKEKIRRSKVTSGNGYVDILLVLSVLTTLVLGIAVLTLLIR